MIIEDEDLLFAYKWFIHYEGSKLDTDIGRRMLDVRDAVGAGAFDLVKQIGNDLVSLYANPEQAGEIKLMTALLTLDGKLADIEKFFVARDLLEEAANRSCEICNAPQEKQFHFLAVFSWLRGYVNWQIGNHLQDTLTDRHYPMKRTDQYRIDAIAAWLICVRVLNELSYSSMMQEPGWYQKIRWQVSESFYKTWRKNDYYAISHVKPWFPPVYPRETEQVAQRVKSSPRKQGWRIVPSIPVYLYVPAGGWEVVNLDEVGYAEIETLSIDGIPHQAFDLMGRGQVELKEREAYALVRIKGTSMNKLEIESDDYVLIHRQDDAQNNDIVLAERIKIDVEATLKRFYKQGNTIELRPESDDPSHEVLRVDKRDNLSILGIAIAVLKPIPPEGADSEFTA
jgi:hypothetical protein